MKKIFTLLLISLGISGMQLSAQSTLCNASFSVVYQGAATIQCNPVVGGTSAGIQHYWQFGDGSSSTEVSPLHTYTSGVVYTVLHVIVVHNPNGVETCRDTAWQVVQIQTPCNLQAGFTATSTTATGNTFHFENTTAPLYSTDVISWTFGDGSTSHDISPNHTYTQAGTYIVCLRVQRAATGTVPCVSETCHTVVVSNTTTCTLIAGFNVITTPASNTFYFENTSTPLNPNDSIHWSFGDGTASTAISATHTYTQAGTYNVCLRVQKRESNGGLSNCIREFCRTVVVQPTNTCTLVAAFTATTVTGSPFTYHFENTSTPLHSSDSISWSFGDGIYSHEVSPNHSYAQPGTYNVCLRVQQQTSAGTPACVREICHTVIIQAPACNLVANFTYSNTAGSVFTYHFVNTSTPANTTDSIRWTFGDGTSSNELNPNHTYTSAGTYVVCLRVQQRNNGTISGCVREICHTIVITPPTTCTLVANFYSYRDTLSTSPLPYLYHFVNTSTGLNNTDSIRWSFGDGTFSNQLNPSHSYPQPGTYNVCLRIQKREPNGTLSNCVREICHAIVISPACNIQVRFTWAIDPAHPNRVTFTNSSIASTASATANWSFGDGTSSTAWNPVHEYSQPGTYYVCLQVRTNANCTSYHCDSVRILPPLPGCGQQSAFTFTSTASNNLLFAFRPAFINTTWQYTWTFGDGTGSHDINATHQYAQPGTYNVCLTVYRSALCASTTCRTVQVNTTGNCANTSVVFSYQRDPAIPNKLYFYSVSSTPVTSQTWTIIKLPASTVTPPVTLYQNNPVYIFQDTGRYRVCLRAITANGCAKEYCQEIRIGQAITPGQCLLQVYPNPVHNLVNVNVYLNRPEMIRAYIYNSMNVLVLDKQQQGVTGTNILSMNIASLPAGTYSIKVIHGNSICYAQFIKL